jgi:hypothetical protein
MNNTYLLLIALTASVAALNGQTALYEFGFNDNASGTTTVSTGSSAASADLFYHSDTGNTPTNLRGADGSGVSGKAGDYALDLSGASKMGGNGTSPGYGGVAYASSASLNNAASTTISLWYNAAETPGNYARLVECGYSAIYFQGGGSIRVSFNVGGGSVKALDVTDSVFALSNSWVFLAATFDGATGLVNIYAGTKDSGELTLITSGSISAGTLGSSTGLSIGNSGNSNDERPFKGLMDDVSIWSDTSGAAGVLSQTQLQTVMSSSIPEPSHGAVLLGVIAGAALMMSRRRN